MVELAIAVNEARLNVTWAGQNGDLPDPISVDATDEEVRQFATEAVRNGSIPGVPSDPGVNMDNFVVDRFPPNDARPHHTVFIRPKVPFGA